MAGYSVFEEELLLVWVVGPLRVAGRLLTEFVFACSTFKIQILLNSSQHHAEYPLTSYIFCIPSLHLIITSSTHSRHTLRWDQHSSREPSRLHSITSSSSSAAHDCRARPHLTLSFSIIISVDKLNSIAAHSYCFQSGD